MPDLYLLPNGEPDWQAMNGRQVGIQPSKKEVAEEARLLFNRFVSDGLARCGNCGEVVESDFSAAEKITGGKAVICPDCNGHFWLFTDGIAVFFPKATDQEGQPRQLRQIQ